MESSRRKAGPWQDKGSGIVGLRVLSKGPRRPRTRSVVGLPASAGILRHLRDTDASRTLLHSLTFCLCTSCGFPERDIPTRAGSLLAVHTVHAVPSLAGDPSPLAHATGYFPISTAPLDEPRLLNGASSTRSSMLQCSNAKPHSWLRQRRAAGPDPLPQARKAAEDALEGAAGRRRQDLADRCPCTGVHCLPVRNGAGFPSEAFPATVLQTPAASGHVVFRRLGMDRGALNLVEPAALSRTGTGVDTSVLTGRDTGHW